MTVPNEFLLMGIMAILGFLIRRQFNVQDEKNAQYDDHLKSCNQRNENVAKSEGKLAERICTIEDNSNNNRRDITWLGDCMLKMGTKLDVQLPDRPKS